MEAEMVFPAEVGSATKARRFAEDALRAWGCDDLLEATRLLVSELVVNAVLHAGTPACLRLRLRDDRLRVEVSDESPAALRRQPYSPTATSGRGLMILDALASRWGVEERRGAPGKTVWFELPHPVGDVGDLGESRTA